MLQWLSTQTLRFVCFGSNPNIYEYVILEQLLSLVGLSFLNCKIEITKASKL